MWNSDMSLAPRDDYTVIWCYFPLKGLDKSWERVKAVYWNPREELWVWENRAVRSYSRGYNPTHWQPKTDNNEPEPPKE